MQFNNAWHLSAAAAALLALTACGGGGNGSTAGPDGELQYNSDLGLLPSPNDLAFIGSADTTLDGTGNASVDALDGVSTIASASATANVPVAPDTVAGGSSVRVFSVNTAGDPRSGAPGDQAVMGVNRELMAGMEYVASASSADRNNRTIAITPLAPLNPDSTYMVIITNGLEEQGGGPLFASDAYAEAKANNGLVQSHLAAAGGFGIASDDVIGSWTFTTQSVGTTLAEVEALAGNASLSAPAFTDTGSDTPNGAASIWVGVLTGVPYYLAAASGPNDPAPRQAFWEATNEDDGKRNLTEGNPVPRERGTVAIPVLVAIPNSGCSPCPIAIYQHGITSNRTRALGLADTLAGIGHATVAIDLPLHGLADTSDPLYAGDENPALQLAYGGLGDIERTFELDLVDNDGDAGPDGQIDPSGEHFINLNSLRTSRDNLRQAVADLLALTNGGLAQIAGTINAIDSTISLDSTDVDYIGQSLGGIVGVPFLAEGGAGINRAVLSAPGGGIAKLLDGSPTIGPEIEAGLEAAGLTKGSPAYEQFLGAAQTTVDTAEPLNYATTAVGNNDVLMLEVVGGNSSPADQVVPNNLIKPFQRGIPDGTVASPTAGTDPLARVMGLTQIGPSNSPGGADTIVRFTAGSHSSIINPQPDAVVTLEMQRIVAKFISGGATVISDGSVVEDP